MTSLKQTKEWKALRSHWDEMASVHMRDLFASDPGRFQKMSVSAAGILLDYSKNCATGQTMDLLLDLARTAGVKEWRDRMFAGERINFTEDRAVLHVALRNGSNRPVMLDGEDVMPLVRETLERMDDFTTRIRQGDWRGHTGKMITDVVNIGIGGSHLGPLMVTHALKFYRHPRLRVHFVSNIDGTHLSETLKPLDPETTLFIVASKSFVSLETLANAKSARKWCLDALHDSKAIARHFVAVSASPEKVREFGIDLKNLFPMWDWVGGRYSLWSAIGLPIVLSVGMERFLELLEGAHEMDEHFRTAELEDNLPVIMALLGIWYHNFGQMQTHAVLPYDQYLRLLPAYLQQADMESNGKRINRDGHPVDYSTGPIVWGSVGSDGQHAYFQLFHQGTQLATCDFIIPAVSHNELNSHHRKLLANCFAQTEALMRGETAEEAKERLIRQGVGEAVIDKTLPQKTFPGNRPSNTILIDKLTPRRLGALIALYEHKIFVQGVIWQINSFDQWGVELGKRLAGHLYEELAGLEGSNGHDSSTAGLLAYCRALRESLDQ